MKNKHFLKYPNKYEFVTETNQSMRRYRNEMKKKQKAEEQVAPQQSDQVSALPTDGNRK